MPDVSTFENNPMYSGYSHGMNLGHPMLNLAAMFMLHGNQMPQRQGGQDLHDSFIQQERSMAMMKLQSGSFMNNKVFQRLGVGGNNPAISALSMAGAFSPDGMLGSALTPALGGNPMAASMRAYTGLTGANTMGAFGRIDSVSAGETQSIMNSIGDEFYNHQRYEKGHKGGTGHQESLREKTRNYLTSQLDTVASKPNTEEATRSIKNLQDQGFNFETNASGGIDAGVHEDLKKKISAFDVTSGKMPDEGSVRRDMAAYITENDQSLKKSLSDRLKKQMVAFRVASEAEIKQAGGSNGLLDPGTVAGIAARGTQVPGTPAQQAAAKEVEDAYNENDSRRKKIESNIADRNAAAGIYTSELTEVAKMPTSISATAEPDKEKRKTKVKELAAAKNKAGEELLEKMRGTYKMTDEDIKSLKNPAGNIDIGKTQASLDASRRLTTIESIKRESDTSASAGGTYAGINFKNTRGFTIEDITAGYVKAADLRMLGNTKGMRPADVATEFTKRGGGAMDAARAVFGDDKSGGELVQHMSSLAGAGAAAMLSSTAKGGKEQEISKMESLLRDVKSTSRVAGISIKTMLGIIDSAKELIANNPQIRNMNSASIAKMSVDSINRAAEMSSSMGARDYREFGGSQEQTARDIQEKANFASSGLGGFGAALLAKAGEGTDEYKQLQDMFKSGGLTASALSSGGMQKIADIMHTTVGDVNQIGSNKLLQRDAYKQQGIADTINEVQSVSAVKSFWDGGKSRGLDKAAKQKEFAEYMQKNPQGSVEEFFNMRVKDRLSLAGQSVYESQQQTIKMDFLDSMRSPEEKKRYKAALAEDKARSIAISEKYAGANAPALTQAVSALAEGKDFKGTAQALSGILAISTDGRKLTADQQAAINTAATAGEDLGKKLSKAKGSSEAYKMGALEDINKLQAGIKTAALLDAKKAGGELTEEGKSKLEAAKKLGSVSKEELDELAKYGPNMGFTSAKDAEGRLNDLETKQSEGKEKLTATEATQLRQLQTIRKITGFRSDKAVDLAQKGSLGSVAASMVQGQKDAIAEDQIAANKKERTSQLSKQLDTLGSEKYGSTEVNAAKDYFKDKGGTAEMLTQWQDSSRGGKDNYFAGKKGPGGKPKDWGALGATLSSTAAKIDADTAAAKTGDKPPTAEEKSKKDLIDAMTKLTTALNSGEAVGALTRLADSLK